MTIEAGLVWCPFADPESARGVIAILLDERLIACGNMLPGMVSAFSWSGERGEGEECGVLFKTTAALLGEVIGRLEELHPYDQPAIAGWTARVSRGTSDWLEAETGSER